MKGSGKGEHLLKQPTGGAQLLLSKISVRSDKIARVTRKVTKKSREAIAERGHENKTMRTSVGSEKRRSLKQEMETLRECQQERGRAGR
jgi:hypothetical protein